MPIFPQTAKHQNTLIEVNVIPTLNLLLCTPNENVQLPALQCLSCLVFNNEDAALQVSRSSYNGRHLIGDIVSLTERNQGTQMQLAGAKCLTYMCRCGIIDDRNPTILFKVLPCLVSFLDSRSVDDCGIHVFRTTLSQRFG